MKPVLNQIKNQPWKQVNEYSAWFYIDQLVVMEVSRTTRNVLHRELTTRITDSIWNFIIWNYIK